MHRSVLIAWICIGSALGACAQQPGSAGLPTVETLPGAAAFDTALARNLARGLAARGPDYRPRTHHLREDGTPQYTNRLILESSPYLVQHAHNPVNWYPWGDAAFEAARELGRPVLLSVGYSTCHWCHVMERESFEDEEIARFLNENYIAIKVDREERPDIDAIYMNAVQAMSGRGGWPMTVWLTPQRTPFFGGTYFPARDGDRGARKGFLTLLRELRSSYAAERERIDQVGLNMAARIRRTMAAADQVDQKLPRRDVIAAAVAFYERGFDEVYGGTKRAPKFPSNLPIRLLLRHHHTTGHDGALNMAQLTLSKMAEGGLHDHVGGGFHRYSTDRRWLVPHFEKMLYDNALLTVAYLEGYQATGREAFADVARRVLDYVAREMTSPTGAFYSATDADSLNPNTGHDDEGWFFTWRMHELETALGEEWTPLVAARYGATEAGNFEGRNILHAARPVDQVARQFNLSDERASKILHEARERLYRERLARPAPLRDDKILASWNGLMISAFARGGAVLDEPSYLERAGQAARFVLDAMRHEGRLRRSYMDGRARFNAYLDDYAFLIAGLLDLYESTWDPGWLREAVALQQKLDAHYRDEARGGYFMTSDDHEQLLAREQPSYDGAEPSGNSVALLNLVRLNELTGDDRYRAEADRLLKSFGSRLRRSPMALSEMLLGLDFRLGTAKQIVIVTPRERREDARPFLSELHGIFLPNRVLVVAGEGQDLKRQAELIPLLEGKKAIKGKTTAYVCEQRVCKLPTSDVEVFKEQLTRREPLR